VAKVKGPLFSIVAMGTVDNKLIYRKRKGIDDVKKYTKTVNPNTPGQQTQKGYFKNAIDAWSIDGYSAADKFAWDQYAKTKKVITSGFNRFTGLKITAEKEGSTWNKLTNCIIYDVTGTGFKVDVDVSSDLSGKLYIGTSKYSMLTEFVGVFSVNKYTFTITGLLQTTKYYFYIENTAANENARTGVYSKKTITGAPPVVIEVGNEAINRTSNTPANRTYICKVATANGIGKITSVEIWAQSTMGLAEVATFYRPDPIGFPNNFTTRDWEVVQVEGQASGVVPGGSKQIAIVDLVVEVGDYIGLGWKTGKMEWDPVGAGSWVKASGSAGIPCANMAYVWTANNTVSLKGIGIVI